MKFSYTLLLILASLLAGCAAGTRGSDTAPEQKFRLAGIDITQINQHWACQFGSAQINVYSSGFSRGVCGIRAGSTGKELVLIAESETTADSYSVSSRIAITQLRGVGIYQWGRLRQIQLRTDLNHLWMVAIPYDSAWGDTGYSEKIFGLLASQGIPIFEPTQRFQPNTGGVLPIFIPR